MAWAANACRHAQSAKLALQSNPVNLVSKNAQLVAQIDQVDQFLTKQVKVSVVKALAQRHKFASFDVNMT